MRLTEIKSVISPGSAAVLFLLISFALLFNPAKCDAKCSPSECVSPYAWNPIELNCTACIPGYYLFNGECTPYIDQCAGSVDSCCSFGGTCCGNPDLCCKSNNRCCGSPDSYCAGPGPPPSCGQGQPDPFNPNLTGLSAVNEISGSLSQSQELFPQKGSGLGVSMTLYYNTFGSYTGTLGENWSHTYDIKLVQDTHTAGAMILIEGNGTRRSYTPNGTGYTSRAGDYSTLTQNTDNTFVITLKDGIKYNFDHTGKITSMVDRNGNAVTFVYGAGGKLTTVTDPTGRTVTFTYGYENMIDTITGPGGAVYSFSYAPMSTQLTPVYNGLMAHHSMLNSVTNPDGGRWSFIYTWSADYNYYSVDYVLMTAKVDPNQNMTNYTFDTDLRVVAALKGNNSKTTTYSPANNTTQVTEANGAAWTYKYDPQLSVLLKKTDPQGNSTSYTYDQNRNMLTRTEPDGSTSRYTYDGRGNKTSDTNALGQTTSYTYNTFGQITSVTDSQGNTTTNTYDDKGNLISVTDPTGAATQYQYDSKGRVTSITSALGQTTILAYDQQNNLVSITDTSGAITTFAYDKNGNMTSQTDALGNTSTFQYNNMNHLIKATDAQGNVTTYTYDANGNVISVTNAMGNVTAYSYDENNKVTSSGNTNGLDGTFFTYGNTGCPTCGAQAEKLAAVEDALGHTIQYGYDMSGRLIKMTDQVGNIETYTYDVNNNRISVTDRKGQTTNFMYDQLHRLTKETFADGSFVTSVYDATGKVTTITDSVSGTISYSYSTATSGGPVGSLINETTPLGSVSYTYDSVGRRTSMSVAGQPAVNYTYDVNGRLTEINTLINGAAANFAIQRDTVGRNTSLMFPAGTTTNYTYDNVSNVLNLQYLDPLKTVLESIGYTYDGNRNATSMNRLYATLPRPKSVAAISYNEANQVLTFNDKVMTYDANGNMTTVTNSCGITAYSWDVRNRLIGISGFKPDCTALAASFKYDAIGRRIEKTINGRSIKYLYDGYDIVQEVENGAPSVNYIRTLAIDRPLARIKSDGTVRYYQSDALGSIIGLTDQMGTVRTQYAYDPYGNVTISGEPSDNPFQYTGRENDGTGLYYYRARYYSPELQRFVTEDPIRFKGGDVNFYAYVKNNPVNWVDPSGLRGSSDEDVAAIGKMLENDIGFIAHPPACPTLSCRDKWELGCELGCHALHWIACSAVCVFLPPPADVACEYACIDLVGTGNCLLTCTTLSNIKCGN